jgi:polysaccharide export outer membrane protein
VSYVRFLSLTATTLCALCLGGCFLPAAGPQGSDVEAPIATAVPYDVVKLDQEVVSILSAYEPPGLAGTFTDKRPPSVIKFGVGDVVSITVFEAAAGGLFIPAEAGVRPGNYVTLPDQAVDNDGNISFPYAGIVRAAGRTNVEVQNDIVARIKNRAIEPQVIVSLSQQRTNLVSVIGEVNIPTRYAAAASGANDRITDAITRAGGIKGQGYETWVMLEREKKRATVPFENLVMDPANNIYVQPNDNIYVYREPQQFIAFGAAGQQAEIPFNAWRINLAEAVAKAGGLVDAQANPGSIFLYRREPRGVAKALGIDVAKYTGEQVPVVFSVSFQDPGGYFLATKVLVRNQDVLFVANAPAVEVAKFLNFVTLVMNTSANSTAAANGAVVLRQNAKTLAGQ